MKKTVKLLTSYFKEIKKIIDKNPNSLKLHYIEDVYNKVSKNKNLVNILNKVNVNNNNLNQVIGNINNNRNNRRNNNSMNNSKNNSMNNSRNNNNMVTM